MLIASYLSLCHTMSPYTTSGDEPTREAWKQLPPELIHGAHVVTMLPSSKHTAALCAHVHTYTAHGAAALACPVEWATPGASHAADGAAFGGTGGSPMTRRIFLDTEWTAPPWSTAADLMWIGLADEQGHSWYGISSDVAINPATNAFISGVFRLIAPDEPRMSRAQLAAEVVAFCGEVDEFWAWIPTVDSFATCFGLGDQAVAVFKQYWDVDLQTLRGLVQPWPACWPSQLHDLHAAAVDAGVQLPARAANHLHPRVHAEWNRRLFARIRAARMST